MDGSLWRADICILVWTHVDSVLQPVVYIGTSLLGQNVPLCDWRDSGHRVFKEISHRLIKQGFFLFLSLFFPPSALLHLFHPSTNDGQISPGGLSEVRPRWQLQLQLREQRGGESRVRAAQIKEPNSCCPLCTAHEYPGFVSTGVLEKETAVQCPIC